MNGEKTYHGLTLLKHCGGGAYGEVYYCRDISGRTMAVKIVSKQKLGDNWQRELKGVINYRKITENAPELLQVFHVEEDEDSFFYTMEAADSASMEEYVPDTLAGRLKNGPLPQAAFFNILSGIFSGIRIIHNAGFAHRDIKPDNIIFVKGVPKLGDIGLLSSLSTTSTQIAGTMDFIPPELRICDGTDSSDRFSRQRNDLYAFGKVVYCTVTGLDPHSWPEVPKTLLLSLPLKFFLRLSIQLCNSDPAKRLDSIEDVQQELSGIERKLMYGETLRDKLVYQFRCSVSGLRSFLIHAGGFIRAHWLILSLACILLASGIWYLRPEKELDLADQKTQVYRNEAHAFSLTIPKQWTVLDNKILQKKISSNSKKIAPSLSSMDKKRLDFILQLAKFGIDMIYCDYDEKQPDVISIQAVPVPGSEYMQKSDAELCVEMKQLFQGDLKYNTEVYETKRLEIQGVPCIFIDLSHDPQKTRINNYLFLLKEKCITVALAAKKNTFAKRKKEFEQVVKTIKFDKKQ